MELYKSIARTELSVRPGLYYSFSSSGMALLGNIVSDIAQTPYEELLRTKILQPLGLNSTVVHLSVDQKRRFAIGHDRRGKPVAHWHFDAMAPAEGIKSTAADLLKFIKSHLETDQDVLRNAFLETIQSQNRSAPKKASTTHLGWLWMADFNAI